MPWDFVHIFSFICAHRCMSIQRAKYKYYKITNIISDFAGNCDFEVQSVYFRWKQAIQQLSVKLHLQHIKSYTSKERAHSLSDWSLKKTTFYFKQTELIHWPLLTLSSAGSVPRQYEADYISQVFFSRMPQGTSMWKTVSLHGTAGKHAPACRLLAFFEVKTCIVSPSLSGQQSHIVCLQKHLLLPDEVIKLPGNK